MQCKNVILKLNKYKKFTNKLTECFIVLCQLTGLKEIFYAIDNILMAVDAGDLGVVVLLDLSAAFDTVDQEILLKRLSVSCGLDGLALDWFRSYLMSREQCVFYNGASSSKAQLTCGVPQGSVLGPVLFTLYAADIADLIHGNGLKCHLYADDTQIYGRCKATETPVLRTEWLYAWNR